MAHGRKYWLVRHEQKSNIQITNLFLQQEQQKSMRHKTVPYPSKPIYFKFKYPNIDWLGQAPFLLSFLRQPSFTRFSTLSVIIVVSFSPISEVETMYCSQCF